MPRVGKLDDPVVVGAEDVWLVVFSGIARQYTCGGVIGFAVQRCERVGAAARAQRFVVVLCVVLLGGGWLVWWCDGASSSLLPRFFVVSSSSSRYVTRAHACAMRSDATRATVAVETATVTAIATVVGRKRPGQNRPGDSGQRRSRSRSRHGLRRQAAVCWVAGFVF